MNERVFCTEVVNSIKRMGFWAYKIPDMPRFKQSRFIPNKPCDIIACINGKFIGIECKQFKKLRSISGKVLRESQHEGLTSILDNGGISLIFINFRLGRGQNLLFPLQYHSLFKTAKPISIKYIKERICSLIQGKNGLFDLSRYLY